MHWLSLTTSSCFCWPLILLLHLQTELQVPAILLTRAPVNLCISVMLGSVYEGDFKEKPKHHLGMLPLKAGGDAKPSPPASVLTQQRQEIVLILLMQN